MKNSFRILLASVALCCIAFESHAQQIASTTNDIPKAVAVNETAPPVNAKEVTLTVRNHAEKPVAIFAGPKEGIRDPKVRTLGGLSLNTLYLRESDVVCLMDMAERKPTACTVIKPGVTLVEVNSSATTIQSK